jgi:hypothetical protein
MSWPKPRNVTEVRSFVDLCSYYRSHVPQFAELAQPFYALTKKHAVFRWTDSQEHAFQRLKESLMIVPRLCAASDEGRFVLDTDSSHVAVGAVLQQEQDGQLRVIGYAVAVWIGFSVITAQRARSFMEYYSGYASFGSSCWLVSSSCVRSCRSDVFVTNSGRGDEGGKRKEGEEKKASGPTASPVLAPPPQIGPRAATGAGEWIG